MKFKRYLNDDGDEVLVTESGFESAKEAGWEELEVTPYEPPNLDAQEPATSTDDDGTTPPPTSDKPLDKMKLTELIEYAETVGVDADTLTTLRKPGASKKSAIEAITAHLDNA